MRSANLFYYHYIILDMLFYILLSFYYVNRIECYFKTLNYHNKYYTSLNLYKNLENNDFLFPSSPSVTSHSNWDFGLLETNDMKEAVDLSIEAFFYPRLIMNDNNDDMNLIEKFITRFVINSFTSFEILDAKFYIW